jgi:Ser-tRNA(Ala) deacylase AlaX
MADEFVEADTPIVAHVAESPDDTNSPGSSYRTITVAGHTCACGGTHVRSTKELQRVILNRVKLYPKENSCKVFYDIKRT